MRKTFKISSLFLSIFTTIPSIVVISSCSKVSTGHVAIPTSYFKITSDNTLCGFKEDKIDCGNELSKYDTLQIPHNVVKVEGFSYSEGKTSFNAIKYVVGDNNGKWTDIESGAFSLLPELTSIILPKTISSIGSCAFNDCQKLNTIDFSNIQDISVIQYGQFVSMEPSTCVTKGNIIVKNNDDKQYITKIFKDNEWLKGWSINIK